MPDGDITFDLGLDIDSALASLEPLGEKLDDIAAGFASSLSEALTSLSEITTTAPDVTVNVDANTTDLDTSIADAMDAPRPPIEVDGDTGPLEGSITDAVEAPQPPILLDGDTSGMESAIQDVVGQTPEPIPLSADATELQNVVDDTIGPNSPPIIIPIEADTTRAQEEIASLSTEDLVLGVDANTDEAQTEVTQLGDAAEGASGGVEGLNAGVEGLQATVGAAKGDFSELGGFISNIGGGAAVAVTGLAVFGGFLGQSVNLAADAESQNKRFASTFGVLADQVDKIKLGDFNGSLEELAVKTGTSSTALQSSASRIGEMGKSAAAAGPEIVSATQGVVKLAAAAAVTNPQLGDTANVTNRLTLLLQRGGPRLAQYGISLSAQAIKAEALRENIGKTAAELTPFDKLLAGTTLALQQAGAALGDKFNQGVKNAQIQLRAMKQSLEETLAAVGGPLLQPLTQSLQDLLPVAIAVGEALGQLAQLVLPVITTTASALGLLAGPIGLVSDGLEGLRGLPAPVAIGLAAIGIAAAVAVFPIEAYTAAIATAGFVTSLVVNPISAVILAVGALGLAFDIFGHKSHALQDATKAFDEALFGQESGAKTLAGQIALLDKNIDEQAKKFIEAQKAGSVLRTTLDSVGGGAKGLGDALGGTAKVYDTYISKIHDSIEAQVRANAANNQGITFESDIRDETNKLTHEIDDQRQALIDSTKAKIADLHTEGLLTDQQLDRINATFGLSTATADYTGALRAASALATKALADQAAAQDAAAQSSADFAKNARTVFEGLATGAVTTDQASAALQTFGLTAETATQFVQAFNSAWSSFVSTVTSKTPDATSAVSAFIQSTAKNQGDVDTALKRSETVSKQVEATIIKAGERIRLAHEKSGKDQAAAVKRAEELGAQAFADGAKKIDDSKNAVLKAQLLLAASVDPKELIDKLKANLGQIADFQANLSKIVAAGGVQLAAQFAQQGPQVAAAQAAAFAGDPKGTRQAENLIGSGNAAKDKFITWVKGTFGPEVTDQVAASLHIKLPDLSGPIDAATPGAQSAAARAGERITQRFHPDFGGRTRIEFQKAANALIADPSVSQAAGDKGIEALRAYEAKAGPVGWKKAQQIVLAAAKQAIKDDPTIAVAAGEKGGAAKDAYGKKADLAGATKGQLAAAQAVLRQTGVLTVAAGNAGFDVGVGFDAGMAEGIRDPGALGDVTQAAREVIDAAKVAAQAQAKERSPSLVARDEIGLPFTQGIALGVADGAPLVVDSAVFVADALINTLTKELNSSIARSAAAEGTSTALGQLITNAIGKLPSVDSVIGEFTSGIQSAASTAASALDTYHRAYTQFNKDQVALNKLLKDGSSFQLSLAAAQSRVQQAQAKLNIDQAKNNVAAIQGDENALASAQQRVQALNERLNSARGKVNADSTAIAEANAALKQANKDLTEASSAGTFIKNLRERTAQTRRFLADISKLNKEGFTALAQALAAAGPDAAGKLADELAGNKAKAKTANAAIVQAKTFTDTFQTQLDKIFGTGAATATGKKAGEAFGKGINAGIQTTIIDSFGTIVRTVTQKPIVIPATLEAAPPSTPRVAIPATFDPNPVIPRPVIIPATFNVAPVIPPDVSIPATFDVAHVTPETVDIPAVFDPAPVTPPEVEIPATFAVAPVTAPIDIPAKFDTEPVDPDPVIIQATFNTQTVVPPDVRIPATFDIQHFVPPAVDLPATLQPAPLTPDPVEIPATFRVARVATPIDIPARFDTAPPVVPTNAVLIPAEFDVAPVTTPVDIPATLDPEPLSPRRVDIPARFDPESLIPPSVIIPATFDPATVVPPAVVIPATYNAPPPAPPTNAVIVPAEFNVAPVTTPVHIPAAFDPEPVATPRAVEIPASFAVAPVTPPSVVIQATFDAAAPATPPSVAIPATFATAPLTVPPTVDIPAEFDVAPVTTPINIPSRFDPEPIVTPRAVEIPARFDTEEVVPPSVVIEGTFAIAPPTVPPAVAIPATFDAAEPATPSSVAIPATFDVAPVETPVDIPAEFDAKPVTPQPVIIPATYDPKAITPRPVDIPAEFDVTPPATPTAVAIPATFQVAPVVAPTTALQIPAVFDVAPVTAPVDIPARFDPDPIVTPRPVDIPATYDAPPPSPPDVEIPATFNAPAPTPDSVDIPAEFNVTPIIPPAVQIPATFDLTIPIDGVQIPAVFNVAPLIPDPVVIPATFDLAPINVAGLPTALVPTISLPVAAAPVAPSFTATGAGGVQTLALDLTVILTDGKQVNAQVIVPVPPSVGTLVQQTRAEVHAS